MGGEREPPLPSFLIVGAQKSGTRWLRFNLGRHPEVFAAGEELAQFNKPTPAPLASYRRRFEGWDGEPLLGEATPGYMMWRERPARTAERIAEALPDVRLIAILREPVARAHSAFIHHLRRDRVDPEARLVDHVRSVDPEDDPLGIVAGGWYARSLEPYAQHFGDRLLVLVLEEATRDPRAAYRRALEHLGVEDPRFVPERLGEVRFSQPPPEGSRYARRAEQGKPLISDRERAVLAPMFADEVARLEAVFGLDLAEWKDSP